MKLDIVTQNHLDKFFTTSGTKLATQTVAGIIRAKLKSCFPGMKFKVVLCRDKTSIDVVITGNDPDLNGEVTPEDVKHTVADYVGGGTSNKTAFATYSYEYYNRHWLFPDGSTLIHFDNAPDALQSGPQNTWAGTAAAGAISVNFASTSISVYDHR